MNDRRRSPSTMGHLARVILFLTLLSHPQGLLAQQGPKFWRGVFLFAIRELPSAAEKNQFFTTLKDSLSLNVFQVRTFGDRSRINYFLNNNHDLWVLNQDADLARLAEHAEDCAADSSFVRTRATMLLSYPKHLRFYLKDEPTNLVAFDCVSRLISSAVNDSRAASVTAFAHSEELIPEFVAKTEPAELMIDPYFIRNNVPHPSLLGRDSDAMKAGIRPWTNDTVSQYGHYLGGLQNALNQVLSEQIRPAASAMKSSRRSLIIIPQLHGELFRSTNRYDTDSSYDNDLHLRPPSPSEIRLQYNIGIAYGAKGFVGYPYGFDIGADALDVAYPGLVDATGIHHSSNFDDPFGLGAVWTGYAEKWNEFASMNKRLQRIGDLLSSLTWVAAKSWTMVSSTWAPQTTQSAGWDDSTVIHCAATTAWKYHDEIPQVEVGHLRQGSMDYIVVVNRRSAPYDSANITVTLAEHANWRVTDVENPRHIWMVTGGRSFADSFEPGSGKVYKLEILP